MGPWIGGFNVTAPDTFQWVTGEPVSFTNWIRVVFALSPPMGNKSRTWKDMKKVTLYYFTGCLLGSRWRAVLPPYCIRRGESAVAEVV